MTPDTFTIGVTPVDSIAFTPPRVAPGQHLVDLIVVQNLVRDPIGERGLCVSGLWEGWNTRANDAAGVPRYTIDVPKLRAWAKALPADLGWLALDIESNVGEFDYTNLVTNRTLRAINAAIAAERPTLNLLSMYQAGNLPYGGVSTAQLQALAAERIGGIASRGTFDAQSAPSGECYGDESTTLDAFDAILDGIMSALSAPGVVNAGQSSAVWFCPRGKAGPLSVRTMTHLGGSARRKGVKVASMWDYVSDFTTGDDMAARQAQLAAEFDTIFRPGVEAFGEAFL